jgi:hypothetical protein
VLALDQQGVVFEYKAEWLNPKTDKIETTQALDHTGSDLRLASPAYTEDIAFRLIAVQGKCSFETLSFHHAGVVKLSGQSCIGGLAVSSNHSR